LGTREFPASFQLVEDNHQPESALVEKNKDLGWMLHDMDFSENQTPRFFRAEMQNGVIKVPPFHSREVSA
jgi:CRISPR-associated protein Cas5d